MDARSFDNLARRLTKGLPRRKALAVMAGAGSSLLLGRAPAVAGCKKVGRKCDENKDCCAGAKCKNDTCKCKNRFTKCNKQCFDLDKDENHRGRCDISCAPGLGCCDGGCVNLEEDNDHCGACGNQCSPDLTCDDAFCVDK